MAVEYDSNGIPILSGESMLSDVPQYTQELAPHVVNTDADGDIVTGRDGWNHYTPYSQGLVIGDGDFDGWWHRSGSLITVKWIFRWGSDTRFDSMRPSGIVFWLPIMARYPLYFKNLLDWFSPAVAGVVMDTDRNAYPITAYNPNGMEVQFHALVAPGGGPLRTYGDFQTAVNPTYPITMTENCLLQAQISYEGSGSINQPYDAEEAEAILAAARKKENHA